MAADPVDSFQSQLNKNLVPFLEQESGIRRREAVNILRKWGVTSDSLQALGQIREYELVATVESDESLRVLGAGMRDFPSNHQKVSSILQEIGPAAEPFVWPALQDGNRLVVQAACRLLAEIGTEESLPRLQALPQGSLNLLVLRQTVRAIQQAQRQPTTKWAN